MFTSTLVFMDFWAVAATATSSAIILCTLSFRHGPEKALFWRRIKLLSVLLGGSSLLVGFISYEKAMRNFNEDARRFSYEQFIDMKINTSLKHALSCSGDLHSVEQRNECHDFRNIDEMFSLAAFRSKDPMPVISNWQKNPAIQPLIDRVNKRIDEINQLKSHVNDKPLVDNKGAEAIIKIASIILSIAFSGSLAEALFQWRMERINVLNKVKGSTNPFASAAPSTPPIDSSTEAQQLEPAELLPSREDGGGST